MKPKRKSDGWAVWNCIWRSFWPETFSMTRDGARKKLLEMYGDGICIRCKVMRVNLIRAKLKE